MFMLPILDKITFKLKWNLMLAKVADYPLLIGGDFNMVRNTLVDRSGCPLPSGRAHGRALSNALEEYRILFCIISCIVHCNTVFVFTLFCLVLLWSMSLLYEHKM